MRRGILWLAVLCLMISGCSADPARGNAPSATQTPAPSVTPPPTATPTPEPPGLKDFPVWVDPELPAEFLRQLNLPGEIITVEDKNDASLFLTFLEEKAGGQVASEWVYALVAAFPTVEEGYSLKEVQAAWKGLKPFYPGKPIQMTGETRKALSAGTLKYPAYRVVQQLPAEDLLAAAWAERPMLQVVPFEQLEPRWKVMRIGGQSPLDGDFIAAVYPLAVSIGFSGTPDALSALDEYEQEHGRILPIGNRDPAKITSLILTGTTAMVRGLAFEMEENGVNTPADRIGSLLSSADILHISNEVSFDPDCPPAKPLRREQRFCSAPRYFELLKTIGVDVIELTGNHMLDWGTEPFLYTLDLYEKNNLPYYGGGRSVEEARKPVLFEHNGNKLAIMGCSPSGPQNVWISEDQPGSVPCDYDYIETEIARLRQDGYLPIFTFQHLEVEDYKPHSSQRVDFLHMAEVGAEIVSGSQSHFPQAMTFQGGRFVHYGLGNTFFDQMEGVNRQSFIDRHTFYNGRYISTELIPIILGGSTQPRLMTAAESAEFLKTIFENSVWQ